MRDRAGHGHEDAAEGTGVGGGALGAAAQPRLDDDGPGADARDEPVADEEAMPRGHGAGRVLADDEPGGGDAVEQLGVRGRVGAVDPAGQDRQRGPLGGEGPAVGGGIDPERRPGHDGRPGRGEPAGHVARDVHAIARGRAGADDRDRSFSNLTETQRALDPQREGRAELTGAGRGVGGEGPARPVGVLGDEQPRPDGGGRLEVGVDPVDGATGTGRGPHDVGHRAAADPFRRLDGPEAVDVRRERRGRGLGDT